MYNIEQIKGIAPAAFRQANQGAEKGASKHYQFMTTNEIIEGLSGMGWNVHTAMQQKSKKNPETTKHMIRFRHEDFGALGIKGNIPEILFVNSHDRTCSLNFHVGIFRLICSNGLVIADQTFEKFKIRHMGTNFETVKGLITEITTNLPVVFTAINKFEHVILNEQQQREFALQSIAIRFPEYIDIKTNNVDFKKIEKNVDVDAVMKAVRPEDNGADLWRVYNRTQEKIIKGGFDRIGETNKMKATREITNIRSNILINKGLWTLAEHYAAA